ncbi:MEKHLA domain-containing protein [Kiloniella majae]|uniref:MEKHLA domain-containing protein n=1 Tax=Kiloniella majae TaxID=1938558 RepID=UPI001C3FF356|nr:MEKHLA domain-containing protein [Kiloniella majae]
MTRISEFQEQHAKRLVDSFKMVTGKDLIKAEKGKSFGLQLFEAPFVVVSHNGGDDPVLNYGNLTALNLWEMAWKDFTKTPSRKTAEPEFRDDRAAMLDQAKEKGYFDNYTGIRISSSGKRFLIQKAIIWTVPPVVGSDDLDAHKKGQAATFSSWAYL